MANTLAYYNTATITAVKSFIVQAPGHFRQPSDNAVKYIFSSIDALGKYNSVLASG